jgi:hypothetical protein
MEENLLIDGIYSFLPISEFDELDTEIQILSWHNFDEIVWLWVDFAMRWDFYICWDVLGVSYT